MAVVQDSSFLVVDALDNIQELFRQLTERAKDERSPFSLAHSHRITDGVLVFRADWSVRETINPILDLISENFKNAIVFQTYSSEISYMEPTCSQFGESIDTTDGDINAICPECGTITPHDSETRHSLQCTFEFDQDDADDDSRIFWRVAFAVHPLLKPHLHLIGLEDIAA